MCRRVNASIQCLLFIKRVCFLLCSTIAHTKSERVPLAMPSLTAFYRLALVCAVCTLPPLCNQWPNSQLCGIVRTLLTKSPLSERPNSTLSPFKGYPAHLQLVACTLIDVVQCAQTVVFDLVTPMRPSLVQRELVADFARARCLQTQGQTFVLCYALWRGLFTTLCSPCAL